MGPPIPFPGAYFSRIGWCPWMGILYYLCFCAFTMSYVFCCEKLRTFPSAFEADKKLSKNKGSNAKGHFQGLAWSHWWCRCNSQGQNRGLSQSKYFKGPKISQSSDVHKTTLKDSRGWRSVAQRVRWMGGQAWIQFQVLPFINFHLWTKQATLLSWTHTLICKIEINDTYSGKLGNWSKEPLSLSGSPFFVVLLPVGQLCIIALIHPRMSMSVAQ